MENQPVGTPQKDELEGLTETEISLKFLEEHKKLVMKYKRDFSPKLEIQIVKLDKQ